MTGKKKTIVIVVAALTVGIVIGACITVLNIMPSHSDDSKKTAGTQEAVTEEIIIEDYDIEECITLGKYKSLTVSQVPTEEDIQWEIDSLIEENTSYEQLKGLAQEGDMVYANFEGYVDGKKIASASGSDYVTIGSGEWLDGFEEAIVGLQCGQTAEVSIEVPEGTYGDEELDGKTVDFKITMQYICGESIVPEYDDELVQSVSKYKTTKEYTKYLREKLLKESEEEKTEYVWQEVLDRSKVRKYPKTLLRAARKEVLQGYYDMAEIYGMSHDEIFQSFGCEDEQDFKDTQLTELARDTVKEGLVAEAVAEKEDITYTTEEYRDLLNEEYENNASSYKSKEAYEKENKIYLERTALINSVKKWLEENTTFIRQ